MKAATTSARIAVLCALVAAAIVSAGCSAPSDAARGALYPVGLGPYSALKGVYGDRWTGPAATFIVRVPRDAQRVWLDIDAPGPTYTSGQEGVEVRIGDQRPQRRLGLRPGPHMVDIPIAPSQRGKQITMSVIPTATFVPAQLGTSGDGRRLGVLLDGVFFEECC
jgi:hypothetical protein